MKEAGKLFKNGTNRRAFLKSGTAAVGAATAAGMVIPGRLFAREDDDDEARLTRGDIAILRFLSAVEQIEKDLWLQYSELGGVQDDEVSNQRWKPNLYRGPRAAGWRHGPIRPRQHR